MDYKKPLLELLDLFYVDDGQLIWGYVEGSGLVDLGRRNLNTDLLDILNFVSCGMCPCGKGFLGHEGPCCE